MNPNEALITRFYTAFQRRDAEGMASCYAEDVHFSDPVFPDLRGADARRMWKMLCVRGKDLVIEFGDIEADDRSGKAHWEARYTFSATGRQVHNVIDARFEFDRGQIVRHVDDFSFYDWSSQALGTKGLLLGWTPFVRAAVRKRAATGLALFMERAPS